MKRIIIPVLISLLIIGSGCLGNFNPDYNTYWNEAVPAVMEYCQDNGLSYKQWQGVKGGADYCVGSDQKPVKLVSYDYKNKRVVIN